MWWVIEGNSLVIRWQTSHEATDLMGNFPYMETQKHECRLGLEEAEALRKYLNSDHFDLALGNLRKSQKDHLDKKIDRAEKEIAVLKEERRQRYGK